jgi:DNA mismatch repair protein MutS
MNESLTPMMKQYASIRKKYPDCILLFRLGDFYEMFFEDAQYCSKLLGLALTSREAGKGKRVPMAGIPHHASNLYISRLIKSGKKVAICEQVEDPKLAKGIVKREVVKVLTPGTIIDSEMLDMKSNNYIISVNITKDGIGFSAIDLSTGEFKITQIEKNDISKLTDEIAKYEPAECIISEFMDINEFKKYIPSHLMNKILINPYNGFAYEYDTAKETLLSHFNIHSLSSFGCENKHSAISAAGALLKYLKENQQSNLSHINHITTYEITDFMVLDSTTIRNLELFEQMITQENKQTFYSILDNTITPMGARLLKNIILHPLLNVEEIIKRQEVVEELLQNSSMRKRVQDVLKKFIDFERISSKIGTNSCNARDLVSLSKSLKFIPELINVLSNAKSFLIKSFISKLNPLEDVINLIEKSIIDSPPIDIKSGGIIKDGYSQELDELRASIKSSKEWIANLQENERKRTGISSLKVGFTSVFGYYIEVSKSNLHLVPRNYIRKQTLSSGSERFITEELKEHEERILSKEEKISSLEYEIFCSIRDEVKKYLSQLRENARIIAMIDVLSNFAQIASTNNYVRPKVDNSSKIIIKEGRHPVVEKFSEEQFVPNDITCEGNEIIILTGPNMAGKSTYLRQVSLIVLMAQIGSFVPAKEAHIGIVDRIFTRVGASDNIVTGKSSFMTEMIEVANIIHNATYHSLIILDEVGRGTSTFDGMSIAWALIEYLHNYKKGKVLFATHFYELTQLAKYLERVKNYNILVKEWNENIIFLRKVAEGVADRSYGIQVAKLAGLPKTLLDRAKEILSELEMKNKTKNIDKQLDLFNTSHTQVTQIVDFINSIDIDKLTPIEALLSLQNFVKKNQ